MIASSWGANVVDRGSLGVGVTLATVGEAAAALTVCRDARAVEAAGFDAIWCFDHVLMPTNRESPYPFTDDGRILWELDDPWFDPLIWLTAIAVSTQTVEIGTNILLAALRSPLVLAKQIATIDQLSGGRFTLGVGAGWLIEEFEALGIPAARRGRRLDETLELMQRAWSGEAGPYAGEQLHLSRPVHTKPVPAHEIPILVGGASPAALSRIARLNAGWVAEPTPSQDPVAMVRAGVRDIYAQAEAIGCAYTEPLRVVYNANEPLGSLDTHLDLLIAAGVTDVAISVDLSDPAELSSALRTIRKPG